LVEAMVAERGLAAVIVNPSTPIGPRDVRPTPTGRIIIEAAKGRIPAFVDTGLNLVHVDDVASGHLAALRHGKIGERYILGGQDVLFSQMLADIAGLVGGRPPRIRLPWRALIPVAFAAEAVANLTGREPLRRSTASIWPSTACSSHRPKPSRRSHIGRDITFRESKDAVAVVSRPWIFGSESADLAASVGVIKGICVDAMIGGFIFNAAASRTLCQDAIELARSEPQENHQDVSRSTRRWISI